MSASESERALETWGPLAIAGDPDALAEVLRIARPLIYRFCVARLGTDTDGHLSADDITQDVCLALTTAIPAYRPQGTPLLRFIIAITTHKIADARRSMARNVVSLEHDTTEFACPHDGPEECAMSNETRSDLRRLIDTLPSIQKLILVMRIVWGMSAVDTAQALGTTPGAVRIAQHRALKRLRTALAESHVAAA